MAQASQTAGNIKISMLTYSDTIEGNERLPISRLTAGSIDDWKTFSISTAGIRKHILEWVGLGDLENKPGPNDTLAYYIKQFITYGEDIKALKHKVTYEVMGEKEVGQMSYHEPSVLHNYTQISKLNNKVTDLATRVEEAYNRANQAVDAHNDCKTYLIKAQKAAQDSASSAAAAAQSAKSAENSAANAVSEVNRLSTYINDIRIKADNAYDMAYIAKADAADALSQVSQLQNKFTAIQTQISNNTKEISRLDSSKQDKCIILSDVFVSSNDWSPTSNPVAGADFTYSHTVSISGVESADFAIIAFSDQDAMSENYSRVCETTSNGVTVFSKVSYDLTIPSICVIPKT